MGTIVSKEPLKVILGRLDIAKAWIEGKRIQFQDNQGRWTYVKEYLDFSLPLNRYRVVKDHHFKRWLVTWTDASGNIQERIFKGSRLFADRFVDKKNRFQGLRDAKVHVIDVHVDP